MTWNDNLSIGVGLIDSQHRQLCDAIDNLLDACKAGKGRNEIISTINFLYDYTKKHFSEEEALQKKSGYPKYEEHKKLHDGFILQLIQIKDDIIANGITITTVSTVNMLLLNWLLNHIKKVDKELAEYVQ